jgi:cell wall-associated NlpC family hydrolase
VAIHASADGRWQFVIGTTYDGWIESDALAFGSRDDVLAYAARASRVITAARATTSFTPELPAVSAVALDMGTTLPERRDWPASDAVNGQSAAAAVVVDLPLRDPNGALRLVPALLPLSAGSHDGPLPATRANLLRQAFSFLGERYGWGHDFNGRDCSGFVCDVYRSLGIILPRNARDQQTSPCLDRVPVPSEWPRDRRFSAVSALRPGDLAYSRRHVMMVVGHDESGPWVIHDTREGRPAAGAAAANSVVVQPLVSIDPSLASLTTLIRVLPSNSTEAP